MKEIAVIDFDIQFLTEIHSGYSAGFAKFVKGYEEGKKVSYNLETRNTAGELRPSLLASSIKGVFRNTSAFLLEKIGREFPQKLPITCDYIKEQGDWPDSKKLCANCNIYGGPFRETNKGDEEKGKRLKSKINILLNNSDVLQAKNTLDKIFEFPNTVIRRQEKPLIIKSLAHRELNGILKIVFDPFDRFSFSVVCLSADLISSGFFRVGRFTSRGYGIIRLIPRNFRKARIIDYLYQSSKHADLDTYQSGFQLANKVLEQDPVRLIKDFFTWS